jgi:hypothetical protein
MSNLTGKYPYGIKWRALGSYWLSPDGGQPGCLFYSTLPGKMIPVNMMDNYSYIVKGETLVNRFLTFINCRYLLSIW